MIVKFMDLKVGDKFSYDGINYEKIPDERISCCRVNNARQLNDNTKVQILPLSEVDTELKNEL